jgi:hypothetical protein
MLVRAGGSGQNQFILIGVRLDRLFGQDEEDFQD